MSSVYTVNKGINKPIEFKGLKAQYIAYLGGGLVLLFIMFAILYICGVNMFVCLAIIGIMGTLLFVFIYQLSDKYGEFGLVKKLACKSLPCFIKGRSRKIFLKLNKNYRHE